MSGNRSLDEFADPESTGGGGTSGAGADADASGSTGEPSGPSGGGSGSATGASPPEPDGDRSESEAPGNENAATRRPGDGGEGRATDEGVDAVDENGTTDETEETDASVETPRPDPPTSTYVWTPDGGTCAACGGRVEERWRDDGDLVCVECKTW